MSRDEAAEDDPPVEQACHAQDEQALADESQTQGRGESGASRAFFGDAAAAEDLSGNGNSGVGTGLVLADHVPLGPIFLDIDKASAVVSGEFIERSYPRGALRGELRGAA